MFSRSNSRRRFSISSAVTRRWIRSRPGSVLILVIALLVLLALIGTAYLSSTQTERYTSVQNTINTEADLLIDGLKVTLNSQIANGVFGTNNVYRQPSQELPTYPNDAVAPTPVHSNYFNYDSMSTDPALIPGTVGTTPLPDAPDLFLADRVPVLSDQTPISNTTPAWMSISYPLFKDGTGYTFDSPFSGTPTQGNVGSVSVGAGAYRGRMLCLPSSLTLPDNTVAPAMQLYVPDITKPVVKQDGTSATLYALTPYPVVAADADGDGIADSMLFKLPIGPIDGITYYAATRTVDGNSAINVSTAWSSTNDFGLGAGGSPSFTDAYPPANPLINYGFFRSNIGLREMLNTTTVSTEMNILNAYRFNSTPTTTTGAIGYMDQKPLGDDAIPATGAGMPAVPTARSDFGWYSAGDALEQQLARRPGNPAYSSITGTSTKFGWLGTAQASVLAYRFALTNPNTSISTIEQILPTELYNPTGLNSAAQTHSAPYAASQVYPLTGNSLAYQTTGYWFGDLFNFNTTGVSPAVSMPLRTILTTDNAVSNAVSSRYGNTTASGPGTYPVPAPASPLTYEFGDWVTYNGYSYVCTLHNTTASAQTPPAIYPPVVGSYTEYWAHVPWTRQPVKTSINTATFDQLWLGFCHVMTDSITPATTIPPAIPIWNPPMLASGQQGFYAEKQEQMFRSVIRDNRAIPQSNVTNTGSPVNSGATRVQLTPMQMMQLRASIAAINTLTMRNANTDLTTRQVLSHHVTLADNSGAPAYDVEVFGTSLQPYVGQVYAVVDSVPTNNFIAIQLLNPYPVPIYVNNTWAFASIDRTLTSQGPTLTLTNRVPAVTSFTIPAATATGPGIYTIYDGGTPPNFTVPPGASTDEPGLADAAALGVELVILKPRRYQTSAGDTVMSIGTGEDTFNEGIAGTPNLYDLVPVDQIDLTGANKLQLPSYLIYKRASKPGTVGPPATPGYLWNFVWPGFYAPYNVGNTAPGGPTTPMNVQQTTPAQQPVTSYPLSQAFVQMTTEPPQGTLDFTILIGGAGDPGSPGVGGAPANPPAVTSPTYNTLPLQLNNVGFPGTNPIGTVPGNSFPFGGFARNADILQVPFIGAYRICQYGTPASTGFFEMNSVTMDSSLANDSTLQPNDANNSPGPYSVNYPSKVLPSPAGFTTTADPANIGPDTLNDPFVEQIGRFCPIGEPNPLATDPLRYQKMMDFGPGFDPTLAVSTDKIYWHYHWAKRIFDYFTVQAPHDDYFPNNVDPAPSDVTVSPVTPAVPSKYPGTSLVPGATTVVGVNNSLTTSTTAANYYANAAVAGSSEDTTGVQGLININTAPWPVLARLPFVAAGTDYISFDETTGIVQPSVPAATPLTPIPDEIDDNKELAKAIVYYRNHNGPFTSIEDLYKVPAFRLENEFLLASDPVCGATGAVPTLPPAVQPVFPLIPPVGDFSGGPTSTLATPVADGIRFDFEERFLLLNQISNLITTRSDTFTCYVLLQGWRNVGTGNPTLAVQRRTAFLVDRNAVTPVNTQTTTFKVPSN